MVCRLLQQRLTPPNDISDHPCLANLRGSSEQGIIFDGLLHIWRDPIAECSKMQSGRHRHLDVSDTSLFWKFILPQMLYLLAQPALP